MGDRIDRTWGRALGPWRDKVMRPSLEFVWPGDLAPDQTQKPPAGIGHNGGPPLVDSYVKFMWKRAHAAAWKTPPRDIALFRLKRAQAAGVDYRTYMLTLLDTGRHMQAGDVPAGEARSVERASVEHETRADRAGHDPGEDACERRNDGRGEEA